MIVKGFGKQVAQGHGARFAKIVDQRYLHLARIIPQQLPARAAGGGKFPRRGGDGQVRKLALAFRQRLEQGDALGAHGQSVGAGLDVAAGENLSVFGLQGGTDGKFRVRRQRLLSCLLRRRDQFINHRLPRIGGTI